MTFSNIPEFKNKEETIYSRALTDLVTLGNPQRLPFEQMVNENSFYLYTYTICQLQSLDRR